MAPLQIKKTILSVWRGEPAYVPSLDNAPNREGQGSHRGLSGLSISAAVSDLGGGDSWDRDHVCFHA